MGQRVGALKANPKNPRVITDAKLEQLGKSLAEFGDLSGIVFNRTSGLLVGGHQRTKLIPEDAEITILRKYKKPTKAGTVAEGFVVLNGERLNYREVRWSKPRAKAAGYAANQNAGQWDVPQVKLDLKELGSFDVDFDLDLTMFDAEERAAFDTVTVREHERNLSDGEDDEPEEPPEEPAKLRGKLEIINGDCLEELRRIAKDTIDAVVTDPPYGWRFMGKAWDGEDIQKAAVQTLGAVPKTKLCKDGKIRTRKLQPAQEAGAYDLSPTGNQAFQKFSEEWAREVFRVLKPGGHALIFCGPRTYHRMACGVEDAGFEVRDQMQWLFGSGFPKSLDISKAIDRAAGAEREVVEKKSGPRPGNHGGSGEYGHGEDRDITAPATAAAAWSGWGTALKPANEPILVARKPISEKTVAANVLKWGTGGLNIDATRIGFDAAAAAAQASGMLHLQHSDKQTVKMGGAKPGDVIEMYKEGGRFPANVLLDDEAAAMLDRQSGELKSGGIVKRRGGIGFGGGGEGQEECAPVAGNDTGGASRFFYCAKASKSERNQHCRDLEKIVTNESAPPGSKGANSPRAGANRAAAAHNSHPTVKPVSLMRYLCRLVTPPNGLVLDPFMGSGSTGVAALREEFRFVGIEREKEYFRICRKRLNEKKNRTKLLKRIKAVQHVR